MALSSKIKNSLNAGLAFANLRIETLTRERQEAARLEALRAKGHFERPAFPLPKSCQMMNTSEILSALPQFRPRFDTFRDATKNDVGFSFANSFFHSPDAEVFYTLIRTRKPARIIEIGSGHSTKIARQAILDGKLNTRLISIDPQPRTRIDSLADECVPEPAEHVDRALFASLCAGDILFIDSSHEMRPGNDCVLLLLGVLPQLHPGVIVHVHDIFLPFDYPLEWAATTAWAEQYVVQALLNSDPQWETLWMAHYLFKTQPVLAKTFPDWKTGDASSLWLRRK